MYYVKPTLKNVHNSCLYIKTDFHDRYEFYVNDFKKLFLANPVYNIRFYSKYGEEYKYLEKAYKFLENKKITENKDLIEIEKFFYQCY